VKIGFLGAYFNHHQKPLSDELAMRVDYTYIAASRPSAERLKLGYGMATLPGYVCDLEHEPDRASACLREADVIITGSAPEKLVRQCIRRGQFVLRYSERPLKNGSELLKYLPRLLKWHWLNPPGKPIYMLCASAYTAADYARFGLFRNKAYRWGYFPEVKEYDSIELVLQEKDEASILWVGRFLDWKHPEEALAVVAGLKEDGVPFKMTMIGIGPMEQTMREYIARQGLTEHVFLPGSMRPDEVRRYMERSQVFLFTSDRKEGWGAVVNEAMNSGCAVVASDAAGSPPYLIRNGENGYLYHFGNSDELYSKVKSLLGDRETAAALGRKAYQTITTEWNASVAAERVVALATALLKDRQWQNPYPDGPCSTAGIIREDWMKK